MSRSRNIKPGFFKNDLLAECSPLARLLFAGLWCEADREGRLEDRPKRLKAECLPYDDCDIDSLLGQLEAKGFIVRYVVDGAGFIAIPEFLKHQKPHMKETASTIPAPDKHQPRKVLAPEIPERAALIPDSLNLIPDSLEKPIAQPSASRFAQFWSAYPNKKGKAKAEKAWKARKLDSIADRILADIQARSARDRDWLRGYVPHGSTYINGSGWEDDIPDIKPADTPGTSKTMQGIQLLESMKNGLAANRTDDGLPETPLLEFGAPARR